MKKTKILSILLLSCICLAGCQEKETYVSVREKNKQERLKQEKIQEEKETELEGENGNKIAKIAVDLISIRELPDARAPKLITLEKGNEVSVLRTADINGDEWSEISVNNLKGYILTKYLVY